MTNPVYDVSAACNTPYYAWDCTAALALLAGAVTISGAETAATGQIRTPAPRGSYNYNPDNYAATSSASAVVRSAVTRSGLSVLLPSDIRGALRAQQCYQQRGSSDQAAHAQHDSRTDSKAIAHPTCLEGSQRDSALITFGSV